MTERRTFEQGWSVASFKIQFPDMDTDVATRLDRINEAITTLFWPDGWDGDYELEFGNGKELS